MLTEFSVSKEILNILSSAGIPKSDFPFWQGTVNLDFSAYRALLHYLRAATVEEIKNLNSLLKEKIADLKSGDKKALRALIPKRRRKPSSNKHGGVFKAGRYKKKQ